MFMPDTREVVIPVPDGVGVARLSAQDVIVIKDICRISRSAVSQAYARLESPYTFAMVTFNRERVSALSITQLGEIISAQKARQSEIERRLAGSWYYRIWLTHLNGSGRSDNNK